MKPPRLASSLLALLLLAFPGFAGSLRQSETKTEPCEEGRRAPIFSIAGTTEKQARVFLEAFQKAVASDDRPKVASMIRYPIIAWAGDRNLRIRTRAALVGSYPRIFNDELKKTIANARTECLFTNWKGVMIHRGEIWLGALKNGDLQVITINRPIETQSSAPPMKAR